ncbi:hypothetical protein MLD38_018744 [Melastoma candidum]|uniref:Uncharacterized protein n=1 Tax=Melastoma candidum TaxID=119954 RepID=A0ACB9QXW8_9MYRT|nr:hypothetical protein MLD38_018744 [Melastoma candidum]
MITGGTETSSNSVEFAMAEIIKNPEIKKKVRQELDLVVGKNRIVEEVDIHRLPYLKAVMKETLRLHPALPLLVPHRPSKTNPTKWENPLKFDPGRFLGSKKWDFAGTDLNYLPFGSGRRICPGTAMGERMILYSLATLLHSFDWRMPDDSDKMDVTERFGIVLRKKVPLIALPSPRLHSEELYE